MVAKGNARRVLVIGCVGVALATIIAGIVVWQTHDKEDKKAVEKSLPKFPDPSPSPLGVFDKAAVSCDAPHCSSIGKEVLDEGGNVVEAAIATLFCMGVIQTQSMGIGGGFFMVFYNGTTKEAVALNAREIAPSAAHEDMFDGNPELAARGGLSVAVPGELKGYWELYQRYGGSLPWSRLVAPTIDLCRNGFPVSVHAGNAMAEQRARILATPSMSEIFINPATRDVYKIGEYMTRPVLAQTLELIANDAVNGGNLLYMNGSQLMTNFVDDLVSLGGIMTYDDMINYSVSWPLPLVTTLSNGVTHYTTPPPGSGLLLSFILQLMDGYGLSPEVLKDFDDSALTYHRFAEAMKHAFAKRTFLGDPETGHPEQITQVEELIRNLTTSDYISSIRSLILDAETKNTVDYYGAEFYQPENHGTSHVSIVGENGDAISVTSTINLYFGAGIRSSRTGIIYNDEMDDFSAPNITNSFLVPPSPNNFIMPGKRPVSSMVPSIFTDPEGKVKLVIGAAGGTQITTSVAYAAMRNLYLGQDIKESIDAPRLHHQLYGMTLQYEPGFPSEYVTAFEEKHHIVNATAVSSVVVGIQRIANGSILANSDFRKGGGVSGY